MCGFNPHSSPEVFFSEKNILGLVYKCYSNEHNNMYVPPTFTRFAQYSIAGSVLALYDSIMHIATL